MSAGAGETAAVVVVGGGVLGCSIAWHLARAGQKDVVVVERNDIGSGATARSAGLVSRGRLHRETMQLVRRTREAMEELERALGQPVGFHRVGSIRAVSSEARESELTTLDAMLRDEGIEVRNIDATEAKQRIHWLDATSARRISYVEDDGYAASG